MSENRQHISKSSTHFRGVSGGQHRDRITGLQDPDLVAGLKSPAWRLAEAATRGLTAPAERYTAHGHHEELSGLGEMALSGANLSDVELRPDIEEPAL